VLVEAVQGEGGIIPATADFLQGLRTLCDDRGVLMLCDEVQCGMGRTGHWFAFQAYDVQPDAFSLAKALGSGYPIGAVVSGEKLADIFQPGKHASTFGGTPLACAAALATIEVIEQENLVARAQTAGASFRQILEGFVEKYDCAQGVRGAGLMLGLVLDRPAQALVAMLEDAGLLALATAGTIVRFLPPLNASDEEIGAAAAIMDTCLEKLARGDV
jgi:acetylornithine/N-succinyldiaminopimelate aminotransferase